MEHSNILAVATIPLVGVLAQWLAWRIHLPSILLLLVSGFLLGPIFGFIDVDLIFGDLLTPIISTSVAVILFEGGLQLKIPDLKDIGKVVRNLVSWGALLNGIGICLAAYYFLGLDIKISVLIGAILVVTGPTVVLPLLHFIRPKKEVASLLKWEGIMIDPVGAIFAVLAFEVLFAHQSADLVSFISLTLVSTLFVGMVFGVLGAVFLVFLFRIHVLPDYLHESFTLVLVVALFSFTNYIQPESGLLAVVFMGIILANQKLVVVHHIEEFKENLTILLLSSLFIILAARIDLEPLLTFFNLQTLFFLLVSMFLVRPIVVLFSSLKTTLRLRDKIFISLLAPRGIVSVAIASVFAIRLQEMGYKEADVIVPIVFLMIVVTVIWSGVFVPPLAKIFNLTIKKPAGILIIGIDDWIISFAKVLQSKGQTVMLIDKTKENVVKAKLDGLNAIHGGLMTLENLEDYQLDGVRSLVCLSDNDELNLLCARQYSERLGSMNVFRLSVVNKLFSAIDKENTQFGSILFDNHTTFTYIRSRFLAGASVQMFSLSKQDSYDQLCQKHPKLVLLCIISNNNKVYFPAIDHMIKPQHTQTVICLV